VSAPALTLGDAARMIRDAVNAGQVDATWVYFIQAGDSGPIKIGSGRRPQRRLRQLQIGNHEPLRLLGAYPGTALDETQLHEQFRHARLRGEWFAPLPELLDEVATLDGWVA
jgi:hypothetical protein